MKILLIFFVSCIMTSRVSSLPLRTESAQMEDNAASYMWRRHQAPAEVQDGAASLMWRRGPSSEDLDKSAASLMWRRNPARAAVSPTPAYCRAQLTLIRAAR